MSQYKMRGNIITYPQTPETVLTRLPSVPKADLFQVAFVGATRPNPTSIKKIFRVRKIEISNAANTIVII